jgi:hypothetical protein
MGHIKVQFNIRPEINRMIDLGAAREEITRSQYIENLVDAAAGTHCAIFQGRSTSKITHLDKN